MLNVLGHRKPRFCPGVEDNIGNLSIFGFEEDTMKRESSVEKNFKSGKKNIHLEKVSLQKIVQP
jgi:hypothetical protein